MGKAIAKKISGMNGWAKASLALTFTLLMTVFMYQGWFAPMKAVAVSKTYNWKPTNGVAIAPGITTNRTCGASVSGFNSVMEMAVGSSGCTNTEDLITTAGTGTLYEAYYNTAYASNTTVTGTSFLLNMFDDAAGGYTVGFQLFYVTAGGVKTDFTGAEVTQTVTNTGPQNYTMNLTGQSATVPAGAKLGLRVRLISRAGDPRIPWGDTSGSPSGASGVLVVDEVVAVADTTPPTVSAFTATTPSTSRNIPVTAFTATDNVGVTGYLITTSSTQPAAGAAGWTATAPTTYTVAADGSYTLYPWAKDAAGNVSAVFGTPVTVVVDTVPPTVSSTTPANAATGVALNGSITINWSEAVSCSTVTTGNVTISGGTLALSSCSGSQAIFTSAGQVNNTSYTVTVGTGVKDVAGNPMTASYPFSFTTVSGAINTTAAGTAVANSTSSSISVTAPYTNDANANNTLLVEYKLSTAGTYTTWATLPHAASPYTTTITGLAANTAYNVRVTYQDADGVTGTAQQVINISTAVDNSTAAGTAVANSTSSSISVTAPYTGDPNANNTLLVEYKLSTAGTYTTWATLPHAASPYTTTITGLTANTAYNVRVTYQDPDGVTGTAQQVINISTAVDNSTAAGTAVANSTSSSISVTAPYTGDPNANNTLLVEYKLSTAGTYTTWATLPHAASPYTTTITGLAANTAYNVRVTYQDADGVTGTAQQVINISTAVDNSTAAGTAVANSTSSSISVTAPYTGDPNANNTLLVEYKLSTAGTYTTWATLPHAASPYTTTITGLAANTAYNVRVTYQDADGVTGTAQQVINISTAAAALNTTTAGTATASAAGTTAISVSAPYTDDANANNTCLIEYKLSTAGTYTTWQTLAHAVSPYSTTITGLAANTAYNVRVTYQDTDGVTGTAQQVLNVSTLAVNLPLMHNSANLGTKYGNWGTTYVCATCHSKVTSNIKRIAGTIATPTGTRSVVFNQITAAQTTAMGVLGNDQRPVLTSSTNVCEVCHHNTTYHEYSSSKASVNTTHNNRKDCMTCHAHSVGFKPSGCNGCHGNPPTDSTLGTQTGLVSPATGATSPASPGAHATHVTTRGMTCNACHTGTTMPTTDNKITMGFAINGSSWPGFVGNAATFGTFSGHTPLNAPYTFNSGNATTTVATGAGYRNSCDVYCHANWPGSNGSLNPSWVITDGSQKACGTCHGASATTPPTTGGHVRHAGNGATSLALSCDKCHGAHTDNSHVDGNVVWNMKGLSGIARYKTPLGSYTTIGATGAVAPSASYGQCTNIYCHSTIQGANGSGNPATYAVPTWGGTTLTCGSCHADMSTASGTGSHPKHANTAQLACSLCHGPGYTSTTVTYPTHANGFINISTTGYAAGTAYLVGKSIVPGTAYNTCSNSYCHSTVQSTTGLGAGTTVTTAAWGSGALNCGSCHKNMATDATAPGSHVSHTQSTGTVYTCDVCHGTGYSATTVVYPSHVNNQINLSFTANAAGTAYGKTSAFAPGSAAYGSCTTNKCHGAMNPTWGNNTAKARCQKCHGYRSPGWNALNGATATTDAKAGAHFNHISSAGTIKYIKALSCAECHAASIALATDNVNAVGHFDAAGPAVVSFSTLAKTGGQVPAYNSPAAGQCASVYCHGAGMASNVSNPPSSRIASPTWGSSFLTGTAGTVGNGSTTPGTGDCSTCHGYPPMTSTHVGKLATDCSGCHSHVNATGTGFVDATKHVNGVVDATGGHAYPYPGATHMNAAGATTPATSCSCHNSTSPGTYPVARGTAPNCMACHTAGLLRTVATSSCYDCHGATSTNGQPKGVAFPNISASHATHISSVGLTCSNCHFGYGSGSTKHGFSNTSTSTKGKVAFNGVSPTPTWTPNTNTCSAACHVTAVWGGHLGCVDCHSANITRTIGRAAGTTLAAVTTEFGLAYGHKKTGRGAVTDADCIVCHLEGYGYGNPNAGKVNPTYHRNGNIDLRDPLGAGDTPITNISGTAFTFQRFSTSYAAGSRTNNGHLSNTDIANVITQKFCLGCHRNSGASNPTARTAGGTAYMPWGGVNLGANYTVANGAAVAGGVVNVFSQFSTGNSSYHPVRGPLNRDFPAATRLNAPYNSNGSRPGTSGTKTLSVVLNCFDCHNNNTGALKTLRTIAAHGTNNTEQVRGAFYGSSMTMCSACHTGYTVDTNHNGAGSAAGTMNGAGGEGMATYCTNCHAGGVAENAIAAPARPIPGFNYHGFNKLLNGSNWPGAGFGRPYAFIRNDTTLTNQRPNTAPDITTGSPTCDGTGKNCANGGTQNYSPGGAY
jgi:predicted CxxxxCH...CXXCH cytochrome family protein